MLGESEIYPCVVLLISLSTVLYVSDDEGDSAADSEEDIITHFPVSVPPGQAANGRVPVVLGQCGCCYLLPVGDEVRAGSVPGQCWLSACHTQIITRSQTTQAIRSLSSELRRWNLNLASCLLRQYHD